MTERDNKWAVFDIQGDKVLIQTVEYPCILRTDGTTESYLPENDEDFKLEELKTAIGGGWIQVVQDPKLDIVMVIDEEGKLKGLPLNPLATAVWEGWYGPSDVIMGDALLCRQSQIK